MICSNCEAQIQDDAIFCPFCGESVEPEKVNRYVKINKRRAAEERTARFEKVVIILLLIFIITAVGGIYAAPRIWQAMIEEKEKETWKSAYIREDNTGEIIENTTVSGESLENIDVTAQNPSEIETVAETETEAISTEVEIEKVEVVVGEAMPTFTFTDLYGTTVSLEQILTQGKAVYITTFASWCSYCKEEAPSMIELAQAYRDVLQFVFIDLGEGYDATYNYHIENELYVGIVGYTPDWALGGVDIEAVPQCYVLSREGIVVESISGAQSYSQIEENIVAAITYSAPVAP